MRVMVEVNVPDSVIESFMARLDWPEHAAPGAAIRIVERALHAHGLDSTTISTKENDNGR